jgi:NADPH2:quinone reductase
LLLENGADEVIIDDGAIASRLRDHQFAGFHKVLELVGTTTLNDCFCVQSKVGLFV